MKKHILTAVLLSCILLSCFSCAQDTEDIDNVDKETTTAEVTTAAETTPEEVKDNLPEVTYDGATYSILTRPASAHYQMLIEEETGDPVNDALYRRNTKIEDRFQIKLYEQLSKGNDQPLTLVNSGDTTFDFMNVRCSVANTMAQYKYCYPVSQLNHIDLDAPFWDAELTEAVSIGNEIYFPLGAANLTTIDMMSVLVFNKDIAKEYQLPDLYAMVNDDTWTFEQFGIVSAITEDINGDSNLNDADLWGVLGEARFMHCSFIQSAGCMYINKDSDNLPYFDMGTNEKTISVFNEIYKVLNDNNAWPGKRVTEDQREMFRNNKGLFYSDIFFNVQALRDMDSEFGIIPFPKYDESQDRYYSRVTFFETPIVPITAKDPDMSSIIFTALTCESYKSVVSQYKEVALKTKLSRDNDSADMIDILFENRILDIGDTYLVDLVRDGFLRDMFPNDNRDIVSMAAKQQKKIDSALQKMVEAYTAE